MKRNTSASFSSDHESQDFYDSRYESGYMTEWDKNKKDKIFDVISELNLPEKGRALDFGCGNGVLTLVLAQALPNWEICGADLSKSAIENARETIKHCNFIHFSDLEDNAGFDLIFSHHVLEHVLDIDETLDQLDSLLNPDGAMLHILPCGNAGSFEHRMCEKIKGGIQPEQNNRFFFEEEGHLRRLSSSDMTTLLEKRGLKIKNEFYSNHFREAIDRITDSNPRLLIILTSPLKGKGIGNSLSLLYWRILLLPLLLVRLPLQIVRKLQPRKNKSLPVKVIYAICYPYYLLFSPLERAYKRFCAKEWDKKKKDTNGSEMFLYFVKSNA